MDIFANFKISELLSLAAVCSRFYHVIQPMLQQFRTLDLINDTQFDGLIGRLDGQTFKMAPIEQLFERFGDHITELSFSPNNFGNMGITEIFSMISKYCKHVKALTILNCKFEGTVRTLKAVTSFFGQLSTLKLLCCRYNNNRILPLLFENCQNLTSLKLTNSYFSPEDNIFDCVFPHLEYFQTDICAPILKQETFFKRHPLIKHITTKNFAFECLKTACPNLESLTENCYIIWSIEAIEAMCNIQHSLKLNKLIVHSNPVLNPVPADGKMKIIKSISAKLPNLENFCFNGKGSFTAAGLLKFVKGSNNLKELNVAQISSLDFEEKIMNIIQMYRNRVQEHREYFYNQQCEEFPFRFSNALVKLKFKALRLEIYVYSYDPRELEKYPQILASS